MFGKKLAFWLGVAGVSVLANFGVELLADHASNPGLQAFVKYMHRGPGR